jgi:hypothetical protein
MMRPDRTMIVLRYVLGLVVLQQSCVFVLSLRSADRIAHIGMPHAFLQILGWSEIVAAILFLIPATVTAGAAALALIFVVALGVHVLHGEFDVGGLVVYTAVALAVLVSRTPRRIVTTSQPEG